MDNSKRPIRLLVGLAAISGGYAPPYASVAQDAFHITFGTTGDPEGRDADGVTFLVETTSGDMVVAGSGASFWSDDGRRSSNPMLARIGRHGELRWQRVYTDFADQRVIAFTSRGEEQYVVLEREQHLLRDPANAVTLRRIDVNGVASAALATLADFQVLAARPVADAERGLFVIAGTTGTGIQILLVDPEGRIAESGFVEGLDRIGRVQPLSEQDFLISRVLIGHEHLVNGRPVVDSHTDLIRLRPTGETELLLRIADRLCDHAAASSERVVCVEAPLLRTDQTRDAIVAYSAEGRALWRREIPRSVYVEHIKLLDSGDLIYSHHEADDTVLSLIGPSGDDVWRRTLRSTGPYTFVGAIEELKDGRLALAGSTGPWDGLTSTDTNSMVIVTRKSAGHLDEAAPTIVSNIVDLRQTAH